jgi:hypothetical protein
VLALVFKTAAILVCFGLASGADAGLKAVYLQLCRQMISFFVENV